MTLPLGAGWSNTELFAKLPPPATSAPAPPPPAPLTDEDEDYAALAEWAELPLETVDVDDLVGQVKSRVLEQQLLLPDSDDLIERCVLALLTGHLILQGPPGTGKTTLARILADAFDCDSELETATADWSTFDVIGGLQPGIGGEGQEVLKARLGCVPRAAIRCARVIKSHDKDPDDQRRQAHWLIIDEFNRADVDKAIGGLYTVLGGSGERDLRLWFEDEPKRASVQIPRRFRIIGTLNDVDAGFVNDLSQGLSRRFQFVTVGVPALADVQAEVAAATAKAAEWLVAEHPKLAGTNDPVTLVDQWQGDSNFTAAQKVLEDVIARVRYQEKGAKAGGWPVGTAQVGDVLKRVALRAGAGAGLISVLDFALADRLIPQMSGIQPVALEDFIDWVEEHEPALRQSLKHAKHLKDTQATG